MESWGKHLIVDAINCDKELISNSHNIKDFVTTLVDKINMVAYGEPSIIHFGEEEKKGYTLVQLIETSNITAHFSEDTGNAYFDIFSCKDFDENTVTGLIQYYFRAQNIKTLVLSRGPLTIQR